MVKLVISSTSTNVLLIALIWLLTTTLSDSEPTPTDERYTESLLVKPLADGHLYAFFEFKTVWDKDLHSINWGIVDHYRSSYY